MIVPVRAAVTLTAEEVTYPLGVGAAEVTYPMGVTVDVRADVLSTPVLVGSSPEEGRAPSGMTRAYAFTPELEVEEEGYIYIALPYYYTRPTVTNLDTGARMYLAFWQGMGKPLWPQDSTDYYYYQTSRTYPAGSYRLKIETGRRS